AAKRPRHPSNNKRAIRNRHQHALRFTAQTLNGVRVTTMAQYDLVVIGTGPGGYVCAIRAAQLGLKTAVLEKRKTQGGTCLNVGCIPSKALLHASHAFKDAKHHFGDLGIQLREPALDLQKMMAFKDEGVEGNVKGVEF